MTLITWTMLLLLVLALVFTIGAAAGRLPLWPAVLLLIVVELVSSRPFPLP